MPRLGQFELTVSEGDEEDETVAYLKLPGHPGNVPGGIAKSIPLREELGDYSGPDIILDFDKRGVLVGLEILM